MSGIQIGIVSEVRGERVRVALGEMVTDFLPVVQSIANIFAVSFAPLRVGEQVVVLPVLGSLNAGVVLRGLYKSAHPAPTTDSSTQMILFEDDVRVSYETKSSTLTIASPKAINITCENANINAKSVNVNANDTTIKSPSIKLLGNTTIEGSISTSGSKGSSGSFAIKGDLNIEGSITTSGSASFGGEVSDSRGSLTNHTNHGYGRD